MRSLRTSRRRFPKRQRLNGNCATHAALLKARECGTAGGSILVGLDSAERATDEVEGIGIRVASTRKSFFEGTAESSPAP